MIFVFQSTTINSQTGFENSLHREKRKSRHFDFEEVKNNIGKIRTYRTPYINRLA